VPRIASQSSRGKASPATGEEVRDQTLPERRASTRAPYVDESPTPRQPLFSTHLSSVASPWTAFLAAVILAAVSALVLGINLTGFPYHENDEGTYVAQAWAVTTLGRLTPYAYTYDHAPLGWLTLAAWTTVVGGVRRFGTAVDTGRVLMLLIQVASTVLVFRIGLRVSGRVWVGLLAGALFALSPVGVYYHRRVLLDNLATLWLLLGLLLLLPRAIPGGATWTRPSTMWVILSGLAFGAAILTKEVMVATLPAFALLAARPGPGLWHWRPLLGWLAAAGGLVLLYPLGAAYRGELLPNGLPGGSRDSGISLIGSLGEQMARGRDGGLLSPSSQFWEMIGRWAREEPLLTSGGTLAALWLVTRWRSRPAEASLGLATLCLWAFFGRGGIVLPFYLVPVLPLLALSVALASARLPSLVTNRRLMTWTPTLTIGAGLLLLLPGLTSPTLGFAGNPLTLWTNRQADAQREAVAWLHANAPPTSRMIVDDALWLDLREDGRGGGFPDVHPYWKSERDPAVRQGVFGDRWQSIEYVVVSPQLLSNVRTAGFALLPSALDRSETVARFDTGGWPLEIRRVRP
jgi:4-amino-4-deoxy-L-arabinose transferase-like glycosyltransferase